MSKRVETLFVRLETPTDTARHEGFSSRGNGYRRPLNAACMPISLDECVNQSMRNYPPGQECQSARYAGFGGLKNGDPLDAAEMF